MNISVVTREPCSGGVSKNSISIIFNLHCQKYHLTPAVLAPSAEGILQVNRFHIKYSKEADVSDTPTVLYVLIQSEYQNCSSCVLHYFLQCVIYMPLLNCFFFP